MTLKNTLFNPAKKKKHEISIRLCTKAEKCLAIFPAVAALIVIQIKPGALKNVQFMGRFARMLRSSSEEFDFGNPRS